MHAHSSFVLDDTSCGDEDDVDSYSTVCHYDVVHDKHYYNENVKLSTAVEI
jgi:hypothetical protein